MNWYKISQQDYSAAAPVGAQYTFPYHAEMNDRPLNISPQFVNLRQQIEMQKTKMDIFSAINQYEPKIAGDLQYLFNLFGVKYWTHQIIPDQFIFSINNKEYILDKEKPSRIEQVQNWISMMDDLHVWQMIGKPQQNQWDQIGPGSVVYHASPEQNRESILSEGLNAASKTRGISNRNTGAAVFTSFNAQSISSYGDFIVEINLGQMKADGYMPTLQGQTPVDQQRNKQKLAYMLKCHYEKDSYESEGLHQDTLVIHGDVPAKYLTQFTGY